jgi:[ribosomal protein S5]-alanine N-acetyltransferase
MKENQLVVLQTERLALRQFQLFDEDFLDKIFGDPEVMRYGPGIQTRQWIRQWLETCLENYQKRGFGPWAVVEKADRIIIGYAGLFHYPDIDGRPENEVGYRLARSHWGHGYATEAVSTIREYGFHVLGLPRLIALIDPQNIASIRVAEKIGMQYEKEVMLEGYTYPDRLYAVTNPVYKQQKDEGNPSAGNNF